MLVRGRGVCGLTILLIWALHRCAVRTKPSELMFSAVIIADLVSYRLPDASRGTAGEESHRRRAPAVPGTGLLLMNSLKSVLESKWSNATGSAHLSVLMHPFRLQKTFGEHGRELVTSELGLALLRALCVESPERDLLPLLRGVAPTEDWSGLPALLSRAVWQVTPLENVRGRLLVEGGKLCERRNGRGVDINRNWAIDWGRKEADYNPGEEYPGKAPFSEPETRIVREAVRAFRPHAWVAVHSGMEGMFVPWDHTAGLPRGEGVEATLRALRHVNDVARGGAARIGSGGQEVGYLAHGTATDYMHANMSVPLATTWEIYGDDAAGFQDCFRMFNPTTRAGLRATLDSWTAAAFSLLLQLPAHPGVARGGGHAQGDGAAATNVTVVVESGADADADRDAVLGLELPKETVKQAVRTARRAPPREGEAQTDARLANRRRLALGAAASAAALLCFAAVLACQRRRAQPRKASRKLTREKVRREISLAPFAASAPGSALSPNPV